GWATSDGSRSYEIDGADPGVRWLGYRHYVPTLDDWMLLAKESMPNDYQPRPSLITDFYAYDTSVQRGDPRAQGQMLGRHWVGDLLLECQLEVTKPEGKTLFELVKGGVKFRCQIDCQSGEALLAIDGRDEYQPRAQTNVRGAGSHRIEFANVDNQLLLWIDGSPIEFDVATTYPPLGNDLPRSEDAEPGDLLPARIGAAGAGLRVSQLRLWRDIYYIAAAGRLGVSDYGSGSAILARMNYDQLAQFWQSPADWQPAEGPNPFDQREEAVFPLSDDQFFMLGDNSPLSLDARLWMAERYVDRNLLVGKALYIFWPHSFNKLPGTSIPFPFFPNFARMRFIR
ncbi:MAG: S26 family signal peptidase, partial [Pirellulales bacterium]